LRVEPAVDFRTQCQRLQFRREEQPAVGEHAVVERFLAEPVARQEQRLAPRIPQREGEHPVEAVETAFTPRLPGMDDDLGVRARPERVAERRQFRHERLKIVNLAVEDDAHRAVLVELRLVAGDEIDDRQPPMSQPDPRRKVEAVAVRSAMGENAGHSMQQRAIDVAAPAEVEDPGYAAHCLESGEDER